MERVCLRGGGTSCLTAFAVLQELPYSCTLQLKSISRFTCQIQPVLLQITATGGASCAAGLFLRRSGLQGSKAHAKPDASHSMQAFSAWIHICAVRLFCESVLRYGVPPKFLAALVKPNLKQVQRLRKLLAAMFSSRGMLLLGQ